MSIRQEERYYLKLKALHYLYEKDYSQTDIATILGVSRVTLKRLLDEAHEEGMVKVQIIGKQEALHLIQLEDEIKNTFHLNDVKLVDCSNLNKIGVLNRISEYSANYIFRQLKNNMSIGFTWGRALNVMVEYLPPNEKLENLTAYTLVGMSTDSPDFQPNILVERFIQKYNGTTHIITAPFFCQNASICDAIKKEPSISNIIKKSSSLDIIMVGIGEKPIYNAKKLSDYPFGTETINELVSEHAVGDICGNFFDIYGKACNTSLNHRIITTPLQTLLKHKNVIGIGGGSEKIESILGALNGRYLNVLITDYQTGRSVLELSKRLS